MNVEGEGATMSEPSIRERLAGCWRLVGYEVTADGGATDRPLGANPLGTILYTPDGYMSAQLARPGPYAVDDQEPDAYYIAYSGPYDVDEQARTVAHHLQASVIPSWLGTTQIRRVQFREPGTLVLSASEHSPPRDGVPTTTTISWSRQPPR
jgi:Lipocalin-like domain